MAKDDSTRMYLPNAQDCIYEAISKLRFLQSVQPADGLILEERSLEGLHTVLSDIEANLDTAHEQIQEERDQQEMAVTVKEVRS